MKLWSWRSLTNEIRAPSGDHVGSLFVPHAEMKGFSPRSTSDAGLTAAILARKIWPFLANSTELPSGATAGMVLFGMLEATAHDSPGVATRAAQIAWSGPSGLLDGSAFQPWALRSLPRTKATIEP